MQKLSLSIGIPMYNHERTIRATLDSIVSQLDEIKDICDLEVVISDNCSTDLSPQIIKDEYISRYPEVIKYFRNEENIGALKNINKVFELATKDYVWLFGDDLFLPGSIKAVFDVISIYNNPGAVLVECEISSDITKYKIQKTISTPIEEHFLYFKNIFEMSNSNISILKPAFISLLILSRKLVLQYLCNNGNYFPHLYPYFYITKTNSIIYIDRNIIVNQTALKYQLDNVNLQIYTTMHQLDAVHDCFGNIDILSKKDIIGIKKHFYNSLINLYNKIDNYNEIFSYIKKYNLASIYTVKLLSKINKLSPKIAIYTLILFSIPLKQKLKFPLKLFLPIARKIIRLLTLTQKPRIFINTMGGLGNQLYQYAFGKAYELKYGVKVNFISLFFWSKYVREVLFYRFTKNHQALGYHNGFCLDVFKTRNFNIVWNNIRCWLNLKARNIIRYNENECSIKPETAMRDGKNVLFFGYFCDVGLFNEYREEILKDLVIKNFSLDAKFWEEEIKNTKNSVSVHIRRGDYVINPIVRKSAVCLSEDSNYYNLAINHIKKAIGDDINLFIFSDDLHWVSENMKFDAKNIQYVEFKNQKKNSHEDMHLMSLCNHNITANSTFSWWGGWMNKNPNKIVTAPLAWTKKDEEFIPMNKGLIYDGLILIDYTKNTLQSKKSIL